MRILKIKKRNGEFRTIYAPSNAQKTRLRLMVPELNRAVLTECDPEVVHGFCPGRSPVTNALRHVGYRYTLSADLKDFFDSVRRGMEVLSTAQFFLCFFPASLKRGAPRQGLPTSPAIANLAAVRMDREFKTLCDQAGIVYTRYADDLTFSGNNLNCIIRVRENLKTIVERHQFKLNEQKTRIQDARFGRRNVTGVMVSDDGIYPSRKVKRRLRAARHQKRLSHARGLEEWMKLKSPNPNRSPRISKVQLAVARHAARRMSGKADVWT